MSKTNTLDLLGIQQILIKRDISIITPIEFSRLFQKPIWQTKALLNAAVKNNVLTRIKKGVYFSNAKPPTTFELANALYAPSYISLETVLSYYRIIPETVYAVNSLTPKAPVTFTRLDRRFVYSRIKRKLFFGYSNVTIGGKKVLIAQKEKGLLDYFYFVAIGLKKVNERFDFTKIDKKKIEEYLPYYRNIMKGRKLTTFNNLVKKYL